VDVTLHRFDLNGATAADAVVVVRLYGAHCPCRVIPASLPYSR
jgi:hypothetical protein